MVQELDAQGPTVAVLRGNHSPVGGDMTVCAPARSSLELVYHRCDHPSMP